MKWTIQELIKNVNQDNTFGGTIDFSDSIKDTEIIKISPVIVEGDYELYDQAEFIFYIDIKCTLTLECAITLKEVPYEVDISVEETFSPKSNGDFNIIDGITIDLLPIIWSNIILEMPMRIVSQDAYDNFTIDNVEIVKDDEVNEVFSNLKNFKN